MSEDAIILLVEDSPDDAYFFQRALRRAGVPRKCFHAWDGTDAVRMLKEADAQQTARMVVFLDLKMPVMNGFEVLEWIQQQPFASTLRVVVLSGSDQQEDRERARQLGASGYLVKPLSREDLVRSLEGVHPGLEVNH